MANASRDTSLWLHNKLGISNDSWTGGSICSQLNAEVLRNIKECFFDLQTQVKLKLLLSFFHIPRRNVEEWRGELEEILEVAQIDSDQWVSMLSETMKTLPATGSLNTEVGEIEDNRRIFSDLVNDLKKLVKKKSDLGMLPLECHYLNKNALVSVVGQQPPPVKHFTLKRKPKSAALRVELLQKSSDASSSLKKSTAPTVPVRSRGMPRKMTDTTPLKGIPSRMPGFKSPAMVSPSLTPRPAVPRTPAGRKDGGIKLLAINEQPLGYAQAKKRKRMQEMEDAKKVSEAAAAQQLLIAAQGADAEDKTPDYAVGLTPTPATPSYIPTTPQHVASAVVPLPRENSHSRKARMLMPQKRILPSMFYHPYVPSADHPYPDFRRHTAGTPSAATPAEVPSSGQSLLAINNPPTPSYVPQSPTTPQTPHIAPSSPVTPSTPATPQPKLVFRTTPQLQTTPIRLQPATAQAAANPLLPRKGGLSLSRTQMLEAQDMFRTANKVTRPEKALILGFMAGSRDNPCPHLGNIVTIKLSENQENVIQSDETSLTMTVETHFQMNYNTGEWKRIKKLRKMEDNVIQVLPQAKPPVPTQAI